MKILITTSAAFALFSIAAAPVSADPLDDLFYPPDANGVLPIERILDQARSSTPGTITEVELELEHGKLIYEVEILTSDNERVEIEYDAKTGAELTREIKKHKAKKVD